MAAVYRRKYKVKAPDGRVIVKTCGVYTIEYRNPATGKWERARGYRDKAATAQKAARLEKSLALGYEGLTDPHAPHKSRALLEHVAEYAADLRTKGRDSLYAYNMEHRLKLIATGCKWSTLGEVEPNAFLRWREAQRASMGKRPGRLGDGASATTLNQYLDTVRAFLNWCAAAGRLPGIPVRGRMVALLLAGVGKVDGEKRRKRRALSDEQVAALLAAAPAERRLVYRVGLAVGLRRKELRLLAWGDVRLAATCPYLQLRAEATKARRGDRLDIPQTLAEDLRALRPTCAKDTDPVFTDVPDIDTWRGDLEAAGIAYKDGTGRQADFHGGTRKTLCSRLHRAGVPLAVAMRAMRHTDAKLTLVDYADDEQIGMAAAVLPEVVAAARVAPAPAAAVAG